MQAYNKKTGKAYLDYYGAPLTSIKKEPNPYEHHYFNAAIHILLNLEGQGFGNACLREKLIDLCKQNIRIFEENKN